MAKFDVLDMNGKKVSTVELSDAVFGITPNEKVMHAAVVIPTYPLLQALNDSHKSNTVRILPH